MRAFRFEGQDIREDIRTKYGYDGPLLDLFCGEQTHAINKWHHYIPLYDRYFGPYRGRPVRFLEIGVSRGGSLDLWRRYFGPEATIYGIDINPGCARLDGISGRVRIGSQEDAGFLTSVVDEMGGIDIVLDDGSHHMDHVRASLAVLFPRLETGGLYMIEDLHTAYFKAYGGGLAKPGNFFADVRRLIDDMHRWYHKGEVSAGWSATLAGVHVHDSLVVFDKAEVPMPVHSIVRRHVERTSGDSE